MKSRTGNPIIFPAPFSRQQGGSSSIDGFNDPEE